MTQSDPLAEKIKWYKRELERLRCFEVPFGYRRVYGGAYCEDATINTTCTLAHNYYPVLSGLSSGLVSGMTFQNARELVVLTEGKYLVNWSMSLLVNSSDQTIEGLIMAGALGTTPRLETVNATRAKENGVVYSVGGTGIIDCAVGELIRLGLENETSGGKVVTVNHANLSAVLIWQAPVHPAAAMEFTPLLTPLTSASWDGDSFSTTAKTLIDLSAVFGVPSDAVAISCGLYARDSGSLGNNNCWVILSPNSVANSIGGIIARPGGLANDSYGHAAGIVPCSATGDIYYQIAASGVGTLDVWLEITGYWTL